MFAHFTFISLQYFIFLGPKVLDTKPKDLILNMVEYFLYKGKTEKTKTLACQTGPIYSYKKSQVRRSVPLMGGLLKSDPSGQTRAEPQE